MSISSVFVSVPSAESSFSVCCVIIVSVFVFLIESVPHLYLMYSLVPF